MDHETLTRLESLSLYPGCSLESSSAQYRESLDQVLMSLEIDCPELVDWNCCGASSAHALDPQLDLTLTLRNLVLAEQQEHPNILAPCAACYHRLSSANLKFLRDSDLLADFNTRTGLFYQGTARILNILDLFANIVGPDRIQARVERSMSELRVVCYYGCLNTRVPGLDPYDDRECPTSMDRIVEALGATPVDWCSRTDCCGASLFITAENVSARLVAGILSDAVAREADCIVVACPMCQTNLDAKQPEFCDRYGIPRTTPVLFLTQLMGLAFGAPEASLALTKNIVPFSLERIGSIEQ